MNNNTLRNKVTYKVRLLIVQMRKEIVNEVDQEMDQVIHYFVDL